MRQDIDIDQLMTETWLTVTMLKKGEKDYGSGVIIS